jgi:hypothetical protein
MSPKRPVRDEIAAAKRATLISPNETDSNLEAANVVDAIAMAGGVIAGALHRLGNADAATPMGGLEALGLAVKQGGGPGDPARWPPTRRSDPSSISRRGEERPGHRRVWCSRAVRGSEAVGS